MESRKLAYGRSYRIANERRRVEADGQLVRAKRRYRSLPDSYDDKPLARTYIKSWKNRSKRKRQWK